MLLAAGIEVRDNELTDVVASSGIKLEVALWVPERDKAYGWWGVVLAGDNPDQRVQWSNIDDALLVAPGTYDVYWNQDYDHLTQPLLLAAGIEVRDNELTDVVASSGIKLEVASWVPQRDKAYGWWGVVLAGDNPDQRVQWSNTDDALLVVPGTYDVYWNQDYDHLKQPLLLAAGIEVKDNELTDVVASSGIKLEVAPWVPQRDKAYGWWGVVLAGDNPDQRVQWSNIEDVLLVVPGTYDVYWNQDYDHLTQPLLLAAGIEVKEGEARAVSAASGLKLKLPAGTPPLDAGYGWWGVVPAGAAPDERVQWARAFDQALLVSPGTYDIVWKQDYDHPPQTIAEGIQVEAGTLYEVEVQPPRG